MVQLYKFSGKLLYREAYGGLAAHRDCCCDCCDFDIVIENFYAESNDVAWCQSGPSNESTLSCTEGRSVIMRVPVNVTEFNEIVGTDWYTLTYDPITETWQAVPDTIPSDTGTPANGTFTAADGCLGFMSCDDPEGGDCGPEPVDRGQFDALRTKDAGTGSPPAFASCGSDGEGNDLNPYPN